MEDQGKKNKSKSKFPLTGPIAWMSQNSVAANLLLAIVIIGGLLATTFKIKQEVFPEFSLDMVTVQVPYPGASPEDTEQGIVLVVEEAVRGIDGVKRVTSTAKEGLGTVNVELQLGVNGDKALMDIKNAVDRIVTFPREAEKPIVSLATPKSRVISLIISGDRDLEELNRIAEMARDELLDLDGITQVAVDGVPPLEVSIEIPQSTLEAYGLSLEQVAAEVRAASIEIPGGSVKTSAGEVLVRVTDRRKQGHEFRNIVLRSTKDGSKIRLGEIAIIRDAFRESDAASYFNGQRAVRLTALRLGRETPKQVSSLVRQYRDTLAQRLPPGIALDLWQDDSELLTGRIDLLVKNATYGLILVFVLLTLFLNLRLAFWVAIGIPFSFLGAFFLMPLADMSINMISLFAFIVTLGMVVDDAIVIGENIFKKMQEGLPKLQAAVAGTREMAVPVTFSVLTTMVAFAPMFFVPGVIGKVFALMPFIVVVVLAFSLIESFFILPAHLAHTKTGSTTSFFKYLSWPIERLQARVAAGLDAFTRRAYAPFLRGLLKYRYISLSISIGVLGITAAMVRGGVIPFNFLPKIEGDLIQVTAKMPFGTSVAFTRQVQQELETAARKALDQNGPDDVLRGIYSQLAQGPSVPRGPRAGEGGEEGSHLVTIEMNLVPGDQRTVSAAKIAADWEANMPVIPGIESLVFKYSTGPSAGAPVDVQLTHADNRVLKEASWALVKELDRFDDLVSIENSFVDGKTQLNYQLLDEARTLGLSSRDIARQLRSAFYGEEAIREQRGRHEIKIMVRFPEKYRRSEFDIENLLIRTPQGGEVPFSYVAAVKRDRAPTAIHREDAKRVVNVKAELAPGVASPGEIIASLKKDILPQLIRQYPGLSWDMTGQSREQQESFQSLGINFAIALFVMFALIAIPFKSYIQPVIIMFAIPFGFVGAVLGHLLMGYSISVISMFGIVALAGVVVNDSLVLVDAANRALKGGMSHWEAIQWAAARRLRPILLTSLTTFFGLMPMISETSLQARFLIPMALSLGFGVLFATFVILLLVPALYIIIEDIRGFFSRMGETWKALFSGRVSALSKKNP
ncbi:MAG: efflux RND transporter permease subunit [Myxococcota bacterium]|nr:efflux RND transporter permease subunit [Myxococcota bacterium]